MNIQTQVKLSQWDAFMVEALRSLGWSDEELIRKVRQGELPGEDSGFPYPFAELAAFASEHPKTFEQAVRSGYQIKYSTIRGIRTWIKLALGTTPQLELAEGTEFVLAELTVQQKERLASVLSYGWTIIAQQQGDETEVNSYRIVPVQHE